MLGGDVALNTLAQNQGRDRTASILMLGCVAAVVVLALVSMATGATGLSLMSLPGALSAALGTSTSDADTRAALVLIDLRLPRTLLAMFVGAALAVAGAMMQGLFRNPLADPGLVGVSSGATLAAVTLIVLGNSLFGSWQQVFGTFALPIAAFAGGLAVTMCLMMVASRN